jgi:ankyrin repeat protein
MHQDDVTALMCASASGHINIVNFLLTNGAKMIYTDAVRYAPCLQYLLRQKKQIVEDCIAAATYDVTDSGVQ